MLEAKDIVIKLNHGGILSDVEVDYYNNGAAAQHEVSLKAGRREVVEWINAWWERGKGGKQDWYELEAKLKEWGIE